MDKPATIYTCAVVHVTVCFDHMRSTHGCKHFPVSVCTNACIFACMDLCVYASEGVRLIVYICLFFSLFGLFFLFVCLIVCQYACVVSVRIRTTVGICVCPTNCDAMLSSSFCDKCDRTTKSKP